MHPQHASLHNELHARPSIYFDGPANLHHFAFLQENGDRSALLNQLSDVIGQPMASSAAQQILQCGDITLKWEQHTEFFTLTVKHPARTDGPLWPSPPALLENFLEENANTIVSATVLRVEDSHQWAGSIEHYGFNYPSGSRVGSGDATVWSDFQLTNDSTNRLLLINHGLDRFRLGRMARRLFDIETYRIMAMLALPVAKNLSRELEEYEASLNRLSTQHAENQQANPEPLLKELTGLSAQLERCGAQTRKRFSATDAYSRIVLARVDELREERVGNYPRLGMFILRRFQPAVRYCTAMNQRLDNLAASAARLNDLLRTRTQVEIEAQNSAILSSMSERAESQLKIQKAVEGLSIIVISYYLFSLFKLGLQSLTALGYDIPPTTAAMVLVPLATFILGGLTWHIWRVKQH
ncbi:MAG: DUF3422 domain-containing protein [Halomonas sp.]|nr:DUF3422 domain-containing protein [Halomonas sp.]TVM07841.1 MAG: DUF3422 domain-containing protein [Halomonas sp.]